MMNSRTLAGLALACAACRADRPAKTPAASAFTEPTRQPASAATAGRGYLVWSADSARSETVWLDDQGGVVATRPQVVVAAGGGLWAWTDGKGVSKGIDCQCMQAHDFEDGAHCPAQAAVSTAALVDLLSGRRAAVQPEPEPSTGQAPIEQSAVPVASVGPYLFTEERTYVDMCGAHGSEGVDEPAYDLANAARSIDLMGADTVAVLRREGAKARAEIEAGDAAFNPIQSFGFAAMEPRWTAAGTLDVRYRFAADACYACTDEHSSAYRTSAAVPAASVPARLAQWTQAPEPVRRYWQAHPPREHAGWSLVDPAAAAAAMARFRAP